MCTELSIRVLEWLLSNPDLLLSKKGDFSSGILFKEHLHIFKDASGELSNNWCPYETPETEPVVAAALITVHATTHSMAGVSAATPRAEKVR